MAKDTTCGFWNIRPAFLQRFATSRSFMITYGLLGTVQSMAYIYFVVSLTTMERRFKIPSKTTGIMLSGNEISQILLSLFLSYFGGQRNRPRWIAWGIFICSLSCFILALPHFLYGAGEDALALTKEYADFSQNSTSNKFTRGKTTLCSNTRPEDNCDEMEYLGEFSILPVLLVFISQFVLGIGNTLYYSLGNTYMDDNTKKASTPMLLGYAFALRTFGPVIGFLCSPLCLSIYIDPRLTPVISKDDARWMGAWWLGWIFLGLLMFIFSFLIGIFPKHLPKIEKKLAPEEGIPQYPKITAIINDNKLIDEIPLTKKRYSLEKQPEPQSTVVVKTTPQTSDHDPSTNTNFPTLKELPQALGRLLKNKLLMANIMSGVFYVLGSNAYITYMAKYIEIQYSRPAVSSTLIAGPAVLIGVVCGFLVSGWYISRKKPSPRRLLFWNVIVGIVGLLGEGIYIFLSCPQTSLEEQLYLNGRSQLIVPCNSGCMCDRIKYDPVCHKPTGQIFFSPCHAGCTDQIPESQIYSNCTCLPSHPTINLLNSSQWINTIDPIQLGGPDYAVPNSDWNQLHAGICTKECNFGFFMFIAIAVIINILGASGKIGNVLVNYRCVDIKDKSFAQGLLLLMLSLFALIPGPILYGAIIDFTCIEWGEKCGQRTNCLMYNKDTFRIYINTVAFFLTLIGVILDGVVWYFGQNLDLYSEISDENKNEITSPKSNGEPIKDSEH